MSTPTETKLMAELQQIVDMCMGDGLDYCRSLTEPKPLKPHELEGHAALIRGCFMGIAHKARAVMIMRAANYHVNLIETLTNTVRELNHWHNWRAQENSGYAGSDGWRHTDAILNQARAVLAAAKGEA